MFIRTASLRVLKHLCYMITYLMMTCLKCITPPNQCHGPCHADVSFAVFCPLPLQSHFPVFCVCLHVDALVFWPVFHLLVPAHLPLMTSLWHRVSLRWFVCMQTVRSENSRTQRGEREWLAVHVSRLPAEELQTFTKPLEVSAKKKRLHSHPSCGKVHVLARCIRAANWFISTFVVYCWAINTLTKELLTSSAECAESLLPSIRFLSFLLLSVPRTIRQKG